MRPGAADPSIREAPRPMSSRSATVHAFGVLVALLAGLPALAEGDRRWEVLGTEQGVEVSIRQVPGRTLPNFKGVGEVAAPLYQVLAVVYDVDRHSEWVHDTIESRLLCYESFVQGYMYHRIQVQWPFQDRDAVMRTVTRIVEPGEHLRVEFKEVDRQLVSQRQGIIRMPQISGFYDLVAVAPDRTRVEYQVDADPGPNLPAWFATRTASMMPLYTIVNLRRQVAGTNGDYQEFVALWRNGRPDEKAANEYAGRHTQGCPVG